MAADPGDYESNKEDYCPKTSISIVFPFPPIDLFIYHDYFFFAIFVVLSKSYFKLEYTKGVLTGPNW